jgi:hypothetical protein
MKALKRDLARLENEDSDIKNPSGLPMTLV